MHNPLLSSRRLFGDREVTRIFLKPTLFSLTRAWPFRRGQHPSALQVNSSVFERTEKPVRQFCNLPFLLTRIWREEEELSVNLSVKVRDVAPVFCG